MTLDKETLKKLRWLIVFTILVFAAVWNLDIVISALQFLIGILAPFLLGAAIAFILSVPMARIETHHSGQHAQIIGIRGRTIPQ